ncbi:MAG TPA: GNAT family N-acetyltransferase [Clostridia bacterium]|nr:GNAT family N-acetyltransferase [Clostridia bacterium]
MTVQFRNYSKTAGITEDYHRVREFFVKLGYSEFTYARWDWMATHSYLDKNAIGRIGLWENAGELIGIATFDTRLADAYCLTLPGYEKLKKEMLIYAKENLRGNSSFGIVIRDSDFELQDIAADMGFVGTPDKENDAIFYLDKTSTDYRLPDGFKITSMQDTYDPFQYKRVLWKGFNHELNGEGEFAFSEEKRLAVDCEMYRPNVDLSLKIAVVAPDGNFVSYCGMWYEPGTGFAVIEPVATDPAYRKTGMGRAAVLEGIRRVGKLGAKIALVGSSQQFYYSIGLRPYSTSTVWRSR